MAIFGKQLANVVEWEEFREDLLFWKWHNKEIKKGSKLIIRQGQDAIFMYNGKVEGIFEDEGSFDIESEIIPFLSSLKGFKFGFNSGMRAEVLFINTKEMLVKFGTKSPINIPAPNLPGGMPIRTFGTFTFKLTDYHMFIENIAGVKAMYAVSEVKERVLANMNQLLMKWIVKEGKDMFNLQANSTEIANGIKADLDMDLRKIGLTVTSVALIDFSYPEEIQKMITKAASQNMVGDMNKYQQMAMVDSLDKPSTGGNTATNMAQMQMGMMMGQQMINQMQNTGNAQPNPTVAGSGDGKLPNFCFNCGEKTGGTKFCPNCGQKLA